MVQQLNPRVLASIDLINHAMRVVGFLEITRVLDLGVGDGSVVKQLVDALGLNCDIYGVDIDERALKQAKERGIIVSKVDLNKTGYHTKIITSILF
jgi:methylase of polypeptide subunit release factors